MPRWASLCISHRPLTHVFPKCFTVCIVHISLHVPSVFFSVPVFLGMFPVCSSFAPISFLLFPMPSPCLWPMFLIFFTMYSPCLSLNVPYLFPILCSALCFTSVPVNVLPFSLSPGVSIYTCPKVFLHWKLPNVDSHIFAIKQDKIALFEECTILVPWERNNLTVKQIILL